MSLAPPAALAVVVEVEEVEDVAWLREVGADPGELPEHEIVRLAVVVGAPLLRCGRGSPLRAPERLLEVGPELVGVLEPDRQPEEAGQARGRLPSASAPRSASDAAEAGHVRDELRARLDARAASASATSNERSAPKPG